MGFAHIQEIVSFAKEFPKLVDRLVFKCIPYDLLS